MADFDFGTRHLDKLISSIEFENQQFVKVIEKENKTIDTIRNRTESKLTETKRLESELSRMDEEKKRMEEQLSQNKASIESLKSTRTIMVDHEHALCKQLESLKLKTSEQRHVFQEKVDNYNKVREHHMKIYESFPWMKELNAIKDKLNHLTTEKKKLEHTKQSLTERISSLKEELKQSSVTHLTVKLAQIMHEKQNKQQAIDECLEEKTIFQERMKEKEESKRIKQSDGDKKDSLRGGQDNPTEELMKTDGGWEEIDATGDAPQFTNKEPMQYSVPMDQDTSPEDMRTLRYSKTEIPQNEGGASVTSARDCAANLISQDVEMTPVSNETRMTQGFKKHHLTAGQAVAPTTPAGQISRKVLTQSANQMGDSQPRPNIAISSCGQVTLKSQQQRPGPVPAFRSRLPLPAYGKVQMPAVRLPTIPSLKQPRQFIMSLDQSKQARPIYGNQRFRSAVYDTPSRSAVPSTPRIPTLPAVRKLEKTISTPFTNQQQTGRVRQPLTPSISSFPRAENIPQSFHSAAPTTNQQQTGRVRQPSTPSMSSFPRAENIPQSFHSAGPGITNRTPLPAHSNVKHPGEIATPAHSRQTEVSIQKRSVGPTSQAEQEENERTCGTTGPQKDHKTVQEGVKRDLAGNTFKLDSTAVEQGANEAAFQSKGEQSHSSGKATSPVGSPTSTQRSNTDRYMLTFGTPRENGNGCNSKPSSQMTTFSNIFSQGTNEEDGLGVEESGDKPFLNFASCKENISSPDQGNIFSLYKNDQEGETNNFSFTLNFEDKDDDCDGAGENSLLNFGGDNSDGKSSGFFNFLDAGTTREGGDRPNFNLF